MLYKEWRQTRPKFGIGLLVYILAGVVVITMLSPEKTFTSASIFHQWVIAAVFLTIGGAILVGADSIAEENGKNTLGFLLTRPLSRASIYTVKFLVNTLTLFTVLVTSSALMFLVEQTPQGFFRNSLAWVNGTPTSSDQFYYVPVYKITTGEALTDLGLIFGLGMVFLALTALVSIYSRSAIQTIVATLLLLIVPSVIFSVIDSLLNLRFIYKVYMLFLDLRPVGALLLLLIAAGIFAIGLKIFKEKEF